MDTAELIKQTQDLQQRIKRYGGDSKEGNLFNAARAQACEFLRTYSGPKSSFLKQAEQAGGYSAEYIVNTLEAILQSYVEYLTAGLATGNSPERRAQLDVVSDYLGQAHSLLEDDSHHPAAAAMVIGASLEEFLRTWVEAETLSLGGTKPGIDAYAKCLRTADLITKQDVKDITSWAGIRNHAAHCDWNEVSDRSRIRIMLEGVNLFMRQKQDQS
jgi:hypothetical protein